VHQVGFIFKIMQDARSTKQKMKGLSRNFPTGTEEIPENPQ